MARFPTLWISFCSESSLKHEHPPRTSVPLPGLSFPTRCVWSFIFRMCCSSRMRLMQNNITKKTFARRAVLKNPKLPVISSSVPLSPGSSSDLVCFASIDRTKRTHQTAGLGPCLTVPLLPIFLSPSSSLLYDSEDSHVFLPQWDWTYYYFCGREEGLSCWKACCKETWADGLFFDVPSLLIQSDGSEEWRFTGKTSLKIIWYIRDAPSGNTWLLAPWRKTPVYLGMTGATLHSLSWSTAIQKQLLCFSKLLIIIKSASREQFGIASHTWIASEESWASFLMLPQVSVAPTQAQAELLKKKYFSVRLVKRKKI